MNCNDRAHEMLSRATSTAEAGQPESKLFSESRLSAWLHAARSRAPLEAVKDSKPAIICAAVAICAAAFL